MLIRLQIKNQADGQIISDHLVNLDDVAEVRNSAEEATGIVLYWKGLNRTTLVRGIDLDNFYAAISGQAGGLAVTSQMPSGQPLDLAAHMAARSRG